MGQAWLVEVVVVSPAGAETTLHWSYPAVRPFPPSDPDRPNQVYVPRLIEPANVEVGLFDDMTRGVGSIGGGAIAVANADGAYSYLRGYAVKSVDVRVGEEGRPWATFLPQFAGAGGVPEVGVSTKEPSRVTIPVQDARAILEAPASSSTYGGTNAGGTGYDGTAGDLKGSPKPLAFGDLTTGNIPVVAVNRAGRAFQSHDGPIAGETALYDRGGPAGLTKLGDYQETAFASAAPTATQFATDWTRGLTKLGGTLGGELTMDLRGDATGGYVDTAPAIIKRLLQRRGVPAGKIGASFDQVAAPAKVGFWTGTSSPATSELVDLLCRSFLGWCVPDALGVWQLGKLEAPAGPAVLTFGVDDVLELEADPFGYGVPVAEVAVQWGRNYRPVSQTEMAPSLLSGGAANPDRVAFLENEYRLARWSDPAVAARYGDAAKKITVETALRYEADAQALANAWGALFGVPRLALRVVVPMTPAVSALQLGASVGLVYPAQGINQLFRLVGRRPTAPEVHLATLRLWG